MVGWLVGLLVGLLGCWVVGSVSLWLLGGCLVQVGNLLVLVVSSLVLVSNLLVLVGLYAADQCHCRA